MNKLHISELERLRSLSAPWTARPSHPWNTYARSWICEGSQRKESKTSLLMESHHILLNWTWYRPPVLFYRHSLKYIQFELRMSMIVKWNEKVVVKIQVVCSITVRIRLLSWNQHVKDLMGNHSPASSHCTFGRHADHFNFCQHEETCSIGHNHDPTKCKSTQE